MRLRQVKLTLASTLALAALSGCTLFAPSPTESALRAELEFFEEAGFARVDLAEVVEGEWTRVVLVCDFTPEEELYEALGFEWGSAPSSGEYHSMFLFATDSEVESFIDSGDTTASRMPWVYPCTPTSIQRDPQLEPVVLARDNSEIPFTLDMRTFGYLWFIAEEDYAEILRR